jgi:trk system potassium uptake protein TrkA
MAKNAPANAALGRTAGRAQVTRDFAVIGLGSFGASLARRLEAMGHMVLGIDNDMLRVQDIADDITSAVALDATYGDALQEVDIASVDTVIVAIDEDFEASALIISNLKGLGIRRLISVAKTGRHRDILLRIGADQVVVPDEDSGVRLAETLAAPALLERVLLDPEHSLIEIKTPAGLGGKPASSLARYGATLLLIQRRAATPGADDGLIPSPAPEMTLEPGDTLFLMGERPKLLELAKLP